jgi:predicted 3-demethylubiquinone-9 3-methyltransferase (glyoxalase superfamily)
MSTISKSGSHGQHSTLTSEPAKRSGGKAQKISPFLWFDDQAEAAATFYVSIFKNSKVGKASRYGDEGPGPAGSVMVVPFQLEGQEFLALNGGPEFKFSPAISFVVDCESQQEVDYFWEKLSEGGETVQCGWLTDKFGLSWQVVPTILNELIQDEDREKSGRVMKAMLQMIKLDIKKLQEAYDQE